MWSRAWTLAAWLIGCAIAMVAAWRLVPVASAQLVAPFDLISEGPHLCTVQSIQRGYDIYARRSYLDLPFWMTPYTPLYHAIVAALPQQAHNPFFTGRVVAAVCMALAAASLIAVAGRHAGALAVAALGIFFLIHSVTGNTAYLRSDSMALCFSVWAVVITSRASSRRALLAAGALCALAVAAKQAMFSATLACGLYLLFANRRGLVPFVAAGAVVAAVLGVVATLVWGTDFWLTVTVPLTDYPRSWTGFDVHWSMMFAQPIFRGLLATAAVAIGATAARRDRAAVATPLLPYMLVSWAVQTSVMTGIGAENHNLIEPILATLLWLVGIERARRVGWLQVAVLAGLLACVVRELGNRDPSTYSYTNPTKTVFYVAARDDVNARMRELGIDGGLMLNLKNSQVPHDYAGRFVINDLWMYVTVLWDTRPETVDRLVDAIRREEFDGIFVTATIYPALAAREVGNYPWARIVHAVFDHYAIVFHGSAVNLLTRRSGPPGRAFPAEPPR